jgi:hypothetical protein
VRKALRHAWRWRRAEQRIRNLARRLDKEWPGIAATILEGIDGSMAECGRWRLVGDIGGR